MVLWLTVDVAGRGVVVAVVVSLIDIDRLLLIELPLGGRAPVTRLTSRPQLSRFHLVLIR